MPQSKGVSHNGCPALTSAFQKKFPTIEHFLTSEQRFPRHKDLSEGAIGDSIEDEPLQYLREQVMPEIVSGSDLFVDDVLISTGCTEIDVLLSGGIRGGVVLEITGGSASGKTQICHMTMATIVRNPSGGRAVYIDTSNSFSAARFVQLLPAGSQVDACLSKITIYRAHDIYQVIGLLENLAIEIGNVTDFSLRPSLLILDSVSSVVSPVLGGGGHHKQGHTLTVALGRALKLVALKYNIGVLCTNHEVGSSEAPRAALGEHWTNQVTMRIRLSKGTDNTRRAEIIKGAVRPSKMHCSFLIKGSGG